MSVGRPPLYETPEQLEEAIQNYITSCDENKRPLTVSGLAYYLGFESRQSLYDYEEREAFSYIVKKARLRVEMSYEERLSESACTGAIFALKNMGWKDKTEQEIHGAMPVTINETRNYNRPNETSYQTK